ncbi:hypothetical protein J3R83DRAFT_11011 [Lanmaoa asiatica]|nr:hypothetical protein J3R83DRAFT_11011 [Lanmaoa asiatica]
MKTLSWSAFLTLIATATAFECKDKQVVNTTSIGAAGEVTAELATCNMVGVRDLTSKRQTCGVSCQCLHNSYALAFQPY